MSRQWANVKIPDGLKKAIVEFINEYEDLGYHSLGSFVADAARRRLEGLKEQKQLEMEKVLD